jgi:hypothetical protein
MPKKEVLELCETAIRNELGSLDDLPYELANTVSNVYYQYFNHISDGGVQTSKNPGFISTEMKRKTGMSIGLASFIARIITDYKTAPKSVKLIRSIDKHREPYIYQEAVELTIDCLKYDIKDAQKKSGLRRMIERKLRKDGVHEIPNLVDLLNI